MSSGKSPKQRIRPIFDFFSIAPNFYMDGSQASTTWLGFICTLVMVCMLAAVVIFYFV